MARRSDMAATSWNRGRCPTCMRPSAPHLLHPVQRANVVEGIHRGGQAAVEREDLEGGGDA